MAICTLRQTSGFVKNYLIPKPKNINLLDLFIFAVSYIIFSVFLMHYAIIKIL